MSHHLLRIFACAVLHSSILLYVVRSATLSSLPRSQVRHPCSTPACPFIIFLYMVRSVTLNALPRSQVRHLCSTPACAVLHSSILLYVVRSVTLSCCHVHRCDIYVKPLHVQSFIHPSCCMWFAQLL